MSEHISQKNSRNGVTIKGPYFQSSSMNYMFLFIRIVKRLQSSPVTLSSGCSLKSPERVNKKEHCSSTHSRSTHSDPRGQVPGIGIFLSCQSDSIIEPELTTTISTPFSKQWLTAPKSKENLRCSEACYLILL